MATTLDPRLLLAGQPYKAPNLDFSSTMVDIAKMKAYQQAQRLEELKYGQAERAIARDEEFDRLASGLFTPEQPAAAPPQRGLAGGPPAAPGGPPPPPPAGPSMAGLTAPAAPGTNYAMPRPEITQMPDPAQAGYQRAPGAMQSLATATAPFPGSAPPQDSVAMNSPRGLAEAPVGVPAPAPTEPPAGLGGAQPGAPKSLLQPINEQVLMRLYAANPEKASKLMEGHLKMQEQKLNTSEKINTQVYQVLSALQASPNPAAMYPRALEALRERGIPIPASFPKEYDAGLIAFKLREHETLKNRIDLSTIELNRQKALHEQLGGGEKEAERRLKEAQLPFVGQEKQLDIDKKLADIEHTKRTTTNLDQLRDLDERKLALEQQKAGLGQRTDLTKVEQTAFAENNQVLKPYRDVRDAMGRVQATGTGKATSAGDMALLYSFNKMLSPTEGVRSEEVKLEMSAGGLPAQFEYWKNWVEGGKLLPDHIRKDFVNASKKLYASYEKDYEDTVGQMRERAIRQGMDPDNVVLDYRTTSKAGGRATTPSGQRQPTAGQPAATPQTTPGQPRLLGVAELQQLAEQRSKALGKPVTVDDVKKDLDPTKFRTQ